MTSPPASAPGDEAGRRGWLLAGLLAISAIAVVVLVRQSDRQYVGYDSSWHVFIARMQSWTAFWREVKANAHPPLYYLVLKAAVRLFGNHVLAYRAVGIAAVAAATVLFGRISARLTGNPLLALAGAAAFGLSASMVEIGLEVRAYALFLAFLLAALDAYLRWLDPGVDEPAGRVRTEVASFASLALLSHYSGYFLVGAMAVVPAVLAWMDERWRERVRRELADHRVADAVMLGVPALVGILLYVLHVRRQPENFEHVGTFLFHGSAESAVAFAARTTRSLVLLFLPGRWDPGTWAALAAALGFALLAWTALRAEARSRAGAVPFVLLLVVAGANFLAALVHRYPWGGPLRHEIHLYPLLLLCVVVGLDCVRRSAPGLLSSRAAWGCAACVGAAWCAAVALARLPFEPDPLGAGNLRRFQAEIPGAPVVMVDQYNLIPLFGLHHDWSWRLVAERPGRVWQIFALSRGAERLQVCRVAEWQVDFSKPRFYEDVADCLRASGSARLAVFRTQYPGERAPWDVAATESLAESLSTPVGVRPEKVVVDGEDVYASFARRPGDAGAPAALRGSPPW